MASHRFVFPVKTEREWREYFEQERERYARVAGPHLISEEENRERRLYHGRELTGVESLRHSGASAMSVRQSAVEYQR